MMTKVRLLLDCVVQSLLLIFWTLLAVFYPENAWTYLAVFLVMMLGWQALHAWYVVHKHSDWQRNQYLIYLRKIIGYGLLTLGIGAVMVIMSFGALLPFWWFIWQITEIGIGVASLALVGYYFAVSFGRLYQYYHRPRSFWDL